MAPLTMAGATALAGGLSAGASIGNSIIGGNLNRKNRKFNAEQAQLNRDFQAQQADIARSWQESFYNQYQSPAAIMRQANEAGIHPYAALGLNPASGPSGTSIPSGSQASAPPQQFQGLADISGTILSLMKLKSEIDLNEKLGDKYLAETEGQNIQNQFNPRLFEQQLRKGEVDIDNLKAGIERIQTMNDLDRDQLLTNAVDRELKRANIGEVLARTDKTILEQATETLKQENIRLSNKNLAEECLRIQADRLLKVAQTVTENARGGLITAQQFEQQFNNSYREFFRSNPPTGPLGDIINVFSGFINTIGTKIGLRDILDF